MSGECHPYDALSVSGEHAEHHGRRRGAERGKVDLPVRRSDLRRAAERVLPTSHVAPPRGTLA